jgi:hypothetical protein
MLNPDQRRGCLNELVYVPIACAYRIAFYPSRINFFLLRGLSYIVMTGNWLHRHAPAVIVMDSEEQKAYPFFCP